MRNFELPGRSPVFATHGMCATSHPVAAQAALGILQAGGNAVDAAIAGAAVLGICEPHMCGLGGDLFALVKPPGEERVVGLNASGRAPAGLSGELLRARGLAAIGTESADSVTIPGAVGGFCRLSAAWGRCGIAASLAPAIRYAEEGVPVAPRVASDWRKECGRLNADARRFYLVNGRPPAPGTVFRAPGTAEVLRRIAQHGETAFYTGEVAEDMLAALRNAGGTHRLEDFSAAAPDWTMPVIGEFAGHRLFEHPPNGQGATAILLLNILSRFDLARLDPFGPERAHLEAEAAKLAYDARDRFIADPDRTTRLDHMVAPGTGARLADLIDPDRAAPYPPAAAGAIHRETVLITVVDRDLMAVSLIHSIYWDFGSGIASPRFGILMQNRGSGFTLEAGHPNEAGGGRRPMHTIIPAMLAREGRIVMPFGVMGGAYQPTGHARILTNMLVWGMDPQEAIDGPRSFFDPEAGLQVEAGYPDRVRAALEAKGHRVVPPDRPLGGAQAILIDHANGVLVGASDPRKDGAAVGY